MQDYYYPPALVQGAASPSSALFSSGRGVKGTPGSRTRSAARQGEHRTGEDVGEAEPLTPLERPKPLVWGAVKEAKRPRRLHP